MVTHEHQQVVQGFDHAIDSALAPMGLDWETFSYSKVNINVNGISKQPDWGWAPYTPLLRDIELWPDPSRGNAIAIKANRTRPLITMDKYEWDLTNGQAQLSQHIKIRENDTGDKVSVSGAPLTIPFDRLFLRPPQPPREGDLIIGREETEEVAKLVHSPRKSFSTPSTTAF
ncbi:hypothetical protein VN97_g11206 [Penicillium thymicola]|uniref:Uncharacterized protein n=1 Tax=Penicillium thymicola TaxID=293382 RepID=A0AAI9T877_PENTH|nr:hypothetical protein VN97_g11206 [Penicillium thymicola]